MQRIISKERRGIFKLAKRTVFNHLVNTKVRRRNSPRPFNHVKSLNKRSPYFKQNKKKRGQGS